MRRKLCNLLCLLAKLRADRFLAHLGRIIRFLHQFYAAAQLALDIVRYFFMRKDLRIKQHFAGRITAQLGDDLRIERGSCQHGGMRCPGGDIRKADARLPLVDINAGDIIIFIILEHTALDDGAGRYHPNDIALYKALGQSGILHLLADGHFVTLGDQTRHIAFIRVERHTAHGRALLLPAVAPRERKLQFL